MASSSDAHDASESYLGDDLDKAIAMVNELKERVKQILLVLQGIERNAARGKKHKLEGLENELSVYRVAYLEAKIQIEKSILELGNADREMLIDTYKDDFAYCRVETESRVAAGVRVDVTNMILGKKLDDAISMTKEIVQKAGAINEARYALDTDGNTRSGTEKLTSAHAAYLRAKRTIEMAIRELSRGEKDVLVKVYGEDLTSAQVNTGGDFWVLEQ